MKSKGLGLAFVATLLLGSLMLLGAPSAEAGIFDDGPGEVTYKEYWVNHSQFNGGCNSDGTPTDPNNGSWYLEPGPQDKCPKTVSFSIPDNINNAIKIEIYLDLWRNYDTQAARFRLNNQPTVYAPPVGSDWSRTPYVAEIGKNEIFQGPNTITFWGDKSFHVHDIGFRVYYDAAHPLVAGSGGDVSAPTGELTGITDDVATYDPATTGNTLVVNTNQIRLYSTVSDDTAYVEFHAYYDGYDEDNDGDFIDWHSSGRNNWWPGGKPAPTTPGGTINHIKTVKVTPSGNGTTDVNVVWDVKQIVNQPGVRFKIRLVDAAGNVRDAAGGASEEFILTRNYPVFYYTIPEFEDFGLHMSGNRPDTASYVFNLPSSIDLSQVSEMYVIGAYWKKPKFSINGSPAQTAHPGASDEWTLGVAEYNYPLAIGDNTITYSFSGSGSGQFIEKPGPMFVFSYFNGGADVAPPFVLSRVPGNGAVGIDIRAPIVVHLGDGGSGVDPDSIVMKVNGSQVVPVVTGSSIDRVLTYKPTTALPNSSVIPVTVTGCDLLGNCMPVADSFSFTTEPPDVVPPIISNIKVDTTDTTATLRWKTDELADSKVDFGLTTGYELGAESDSAPVLDHTIVLTGLTPDTLYDAKITSTDQDGNPVSTQNQVFRTKKVPGAVRSDDFNSCTLNDGIWSYIDPIGDATFTKNGETLSIAVPGGLSHDIWKSGIKAPRAMQAVTDQDFTIVTKMDSTVSQKIQMQGILVQQDDSNYLRFNLQYDGAPILAVVDGNNGNPFLLFSAPLPAVPSYLRVVRQLTFWSLDYSFDGTTWTTGTTIPSKALTVSQVGVFAGNTGTYPAHTATFDYFFNSASPIDPEDPPKTVTVNMVGVGTVVKNPEKAVYTCNEEVQLTATPAQDWTFVGWSGALSGTNPVQSLTITEPAVVTATFENNTSYTLEVNKALVGGVDGGEITVDPVQSGYAYGDEIDLTATPSLGWSFTGWSGSFNSVNPLETYVITSNSVITGTFTKDQYTLSVGLFNEGVGIGGTVSKSPDQPTYGYGDQVTVQIASVTEGWEFVGWEGDVVSAATSVVVDMTSNRSVVAHFRQQQHDLETNIISIPVLGQTGPGGTILRDPDKLTYGHGESVTFTAAPFGGWAFDGWSGDLTGTNLTETLVISDDMSITATFSQHLFTLDVTSNGEGSVTVEPEQAEYLFGDLVTLTAVPDSDLYNFVGWGGDLAGTGNPAVVTMEKDTVINATFELDTTPIEIINYQVDVLPNGKTAKVIWTTDEPGTSQVKFGLTPFYDQMKSDGALQTSHLLTLTGLQPETTYHYLITSVDQHGNTVTTGDVTFSTAATAGIISDDFALCGGLNPSYWEFINPLTDGDYMATGTTLELMAAGGTEHNVYINGNDGVRAMQPAEDKDFVIQVKFDSGLADDGAIQGIIIEQDAENFMRFDFYKRNGEIVVYYAAFADLTPVIANNKIKIADVPGPLYMRITRTGDTWLQEYSFDGQSWSTTSSKPFTHLMNVTHVGPYAGNFTVSGGVPAHTAVVDYFFNMAAPLAPEDGPYVVKTSVVGNGTVTRNPDKQGYACGEQVELQATAKGDAAFAAWSGDLSGTTPTQTLTVEGNLNATAIFFSGDGPFNAFMPMAIGK